MQCMLGVKLGPAADLGHGLRLAKQLVLTPLFLSGWLIIGDSTSLLVYFLKEKLSE